MTTLQQALDVVSQLPRDQQAMLADIVRSRLIELQRQEIAQEAQEAMTEFRSGQLQPQSAANAIAELRTFLGQNFNSGEG